MKTGRLLLAVWSIFAIAALVGPALQWVVFATGMAKGDPSSPAAQAIGDVVLMLWPAQPLAVVEVNIGGPAALGVALGSNILLFSLVGLVAAVAVRRMGFLIALFIVVLIVTVLWALVWAGFTWRHVGVLGLACAIILEAFLFAMTAWLRRRWVDAR